MADLEHIRSVLSQQFEQYIIETFINYCHEEQYEEANIEEDIEEPKDSMIYEHMQSKLQWNDNQTHRFIQALQSAINPQIIQHNDTDSDDDIYSFDYEPQNTSKELQSILKVLSSSYKPQIIQIFSTFCQEQEYLEKANILEDIEEDGDSFIAEHMQSQCNWNKHQSRSFINTLYNILQNKAQPPPLQHIHPIAHHLHKMLSLPMMNNHTPNMQYKAKVAALLLMHMTMNNMKRSSSSHTITATCCHGNKHIINKSMSFQDKTLIKKHHNHSVSHNNLYLHQNKMDERKTNKDPMKDYTNIDVETRARISLRKSMKKQFQNGTFYKNTKPFVSRNVTPFNDDDDWKTVVDESWSPPLFNDSSRNNHQNADRMVGLKNIGATCYMNAVLQSLYCSDMYRDFLINDVGELRYDAKYAKKYRMPKQPLHEVEHQYSLQQQATIELKNLLRNLDDKDSSVINTESFVKRLPKRWRPGKQQDSNEFAKFVLNCTWETIDQSSVMKDIYSKTEFNWAEIHQLKQLRLDPYSHGMLNYTTLCVDCNSKSAQFEAFFDLSLALPKQDECKVSTKQLIDDHMKAEHLSFDNKYFCNKCERNVKAMRFISIVRPPKLLLLCFKRYQLNTRTQSREKIMTNVDCPLLLQIDRDIQDSQNHEIVPYILYAVVVHHGSNAQFGHYYAIGRHSNDAAKCYTNNKSITNNTDKKGVYDALNGGNWYKFDDERVSKSSYDQLSSLSIHDTPYMLFYLRVDDE